MNEFVKPVVETARAGMTKAITHLESELNKIRAGKANPAMIEGVKAPAYGSQMPLKELGNIMAPEARLLTVEPYDKSLLAAIEKALRDSGLGLNPQSDGKLIRIPFPPPTEERRKELVKKSKEEGETAKVAIRNLRREGNEALKKLKDKGTPEDAIKDGEKDMQKLTDDMVAKVDNTIKAKEKEIMTI